MSQMVRYNRNSTRPFFHQSIFKVYQTSTLEVTVYQKNFWVLGVI